MTQRIIIRSATTNDVKDAAGLLVAYRAFYNLEPQSVETVESFIQERLNKNEVHILLAYIKDKAVGIAQLYSGYSTLSLGKIWTLYDLYIDQNYRGKGIGRILLDACRDFARSDGGFRLDLKTERDNLPANVLYEKFGFSKDNVYVHCQMLLS